MEGRIEQDPVIVYDYEFSSQDTGFKQKQSTKAAPKWVDLAAQEGIQQLTYKNKFGEVYRYDISWHEPTLEEKIELFKRNYENADGTQPKMYVLEKFLEEVLGIKI